MKKILSTVAIAGLLSTGAMAGDMYGSIGAAMTTESDFDSGVSVVVTAGMKLDSVYPGFAVEVEASQTVVDLTYDYSGYGASGDLELSILGLGAYAVYNFEIPNSPIVIKPRVGLNYQSWEVDYAGYGGDADDTSLSFGIGATYPLNDGLTAYVDFTDKGDSNNIGAGVGMSF